MCLHPNNTEQPVCLSSTCSSLFGFYRLQEDGARTKALLLKVCHRVGSLSRLPLEIVQIPCEIRA